MNTYQCKCGWQGTEDELVSSKLANDSDDVILVTALGQSLRFSVKTLRSKTERASDMVVARMSVWRPLKTTYSRSLPIPRVSSVNLMRTCLQSPPRRSPPPRRRSVCG